MQNFLWIIMCIKKIGELASLSAFMSFSFSFILWCCPGHRSAIDFIFSFLLWVPTLYLFFITYKQYNLEKNSQNNKVEKKEFLEDYHIVEDQLILHKMFNKD